MSITWESNFGSVTVNALHEQTLALFFHFLTLHSKELEEPHPIHVQRVVCNEEQVKGRTLLLTWSLSKDTNSSQVVSISMYHSKHFLLSTIS